jgi:hypothetical protein
MPANFSPEYKTAEAAYRRAREPRERHVSLTGRWDAVAAPPRVGETGDDDPFTARRGQTVRDVARLVHHDLARTVRYARVFGHAGFEAQQVGPDHVLADGDIIELHG